MTTETKPRTLEDVVRDARLCADGPSQSLGDVYRAEELVREAHALGLAEGRAGAGVDLREALDALWMVIDGYDESGQHYIPSGASRRAREVLITLRSPPPEDSGRLRAEVERQVEENVMLRARAHGREEQLAAEVERLTWQRATCDGSCDIALARRQVGPDGLIPGNAKECAEMWEREASRSHAECRAVKVERDEARASLARVTEERDEARRWMAKGEAAYCGSGIISEVLAFFEAARCGQPGTPNTVWAMTQEIIARAEKAEAEVARLRSEARRSAEIEQAARHVLSWQEHNVGPEIAALRAALRAPEVNP